MTVPLTKREATVLANLIDDVFDSPARLAEACPHRNDAKALRRAERKLTDFIVGETDG